MLHYVTCLHPDESGLWQAGAGQGFKIKVKIKSEVKDGRRFRIHDSNKPVLSGAKPVSVPTRRDRQAGFVETGIEDCIHATLRCAGQGF